MSDNDTPPAAIPVTSQLPSPAEDKPRRRARGRKPQDEVKDEANDIFAEEAAARQAEEAARTEIERAADVTSEPKVNDERTRSRLVDPFQSITVPLTEDKGDMGNISAPGGSSRPFDFDSAHRLTHDAWGSLRATVTYNAGSGLVQTATDADGGLMHEFDFVIDDSASPDHLFIEDFEHDSHPV